MTFNDAMEAVSSGKVVRRQTWVERAMELGLCDDPVTGIPTLVIVRGARLWTGWEASDEDKAATDWELVENDTLAWLGCGPREVL